MRRYKKERSRSTSDISGFCTRLEERCGALGLTVTEAAQRAGLQRTTPYMWYKGTAPNRSTAIRLATVLCTTPEYLLSGEKDGCNDHFDQDTQKLLYLFCGLSKDQRHKVLDYVSQVPSLECGSKMVIK